MFSALKISIVPAAAILALTGVLIAQQAPDLPDLSSIAADLVTPAVEAGSPGPGKRIKQFAPGYEGTGVYHALYLPVDWRPGKRYPIIVEYAGNGPYQSKYGDFSSGMVEGSNLGFGMSGGKGFIWISMPYVNSSEKRNQLWWWGDLAATVEYCERTVRNTCERYGGDPSAIIIAGFSRGAIACNYVGLHDDKIADIWLGFIAYSHYDGVRSWDYGQSDRASALDRLKRLHGRPVFACHEQSIKDTRDYVEDTGFGATFTFVTIPFRNHNDAWVLRDIPERRHLRDWLKNVVASKPGTHAIAGFVRDAAGRPLSGVRVQSGETHWTMTRKNGRYVLAGLIDSKRTVSASKAGFGTKSQTVVLTTSNIVDLNFSLPRRR